MRMMYYEFPAFYTVLTAALLAFLATVSQAKAQDFPSCKLDAGSTVPPTCEIARVEVEQSTVSIDEIIICPVEACHWRFARGSDDTIALIEMVPAAGTVHMYEFVETSGVIFMSPDWDRFRALVAEPSALDEFAG